MHIFQNNCLSGGASSVVAIVQCYFFSNKDNIDDRNYLKLKYKGNISQNFSLRIFTSITFFCYLSLRYFLKFKFQSIIFSLFNQFKINSFNFKIYLLLLFELKND